MPKMGFRITTWNVNGIRNPFGYQPWREKRTFQAMFDILEADIVIMQETKIQRKDLSDDMVLVPGWDVYFSLPRHKKGYSGVAIYTRNTSCAPIRAEEGITGALCPPRSTTQFRNLPKDQQIGGYPQPGQLSGNIDELLLDSEGRCVILEFPGFVLIGVYSPANRDETRVEFRLGFLQALDVRIRNLIAEGKQVILTGDLNVTRSVIDSTNLVETLRKEGMTLGEWRQMPSRRMFNQLVFGGEGAGDAGEFEAEDKDQREQPVLWDLCREFHPLREGMNTCWDTKRNTRPANNGSRIDYVLCSDGLRNWFTHADIQEGLMGSDHCPVFATMADKVAVGSMEIPLPDLVNPPGMFEEGRRVREWNGRDVLALSAKLIPEFEGRQSIRDMFSRRSGPGPSTPRQPFSRPEGATGVESLQGSGIEAKADSKYSDDDAKSGPDLVGIGGDENQHRCHSPLAGSTTGDATAVATTATAVASTAVSATPTPAVAAAAASSSKRAAGPLVEESSESSSKRSKVPAKAGSIASGHGARAKAGRGGGGTGGQKTLQGFFKPVALPRATGEANRTNMSLGATQTTHATRQTPGPLSGTSMADTPQGVSADDWPCSLPRPGQQGHGLQGSGQGQGSIPTRQRQDESTGQRQGPSQDERQDQSQDKVFDPIQAKESWSKLLGKRVLPRCEHGEPCISFVTKKPGVNCGRSFYICPRPLGPSGEKEKGSEWRCGTFIWSSDWNGQST